MFLISFFGKYCCSGTSYRQVASKRREQVQTENIPTDGIIIVITDYFKHCIRLIYKK